MPVPPNIFDQIESKPIAERVVRQIEDLIVQGVLSEGDKLPSERELSAQLNISRPKLRDALKTLEESGLIHSRHGEGTFIAKLTGEAMAPALVNLYARQGKAFFDYLEYRRAQEGFAARLAAERATKTDLAQLRLQLDALERADADNDPKAAQQADVRLHTRIVEASHNALLVHMMASIYELTRRGVFYNRDYLRAMDGSGAKLLQQHRDITEAICARDPSTAEAAAMAHMDFVEQSFRTGMRQTETELVAAKRAAAHGGD
ncbi:MAG: FadR/GntR family transcriptional regulator [Pseudomonadota bacterium]